MKLRKYQIEAVNAVLRELAVKQSTLLVMATGTGKTIVFSQIATRFKRVLVLAHRDELIQQAVDKYGIAIIPSPTSCREIGIEKATQHASRDCGLVVASVQTLRGKRLKSWHPNHFDLIIIDEAHHASAISYRRIRDHFKSTKVLGVTATPNRGDKQDIMQHFDSVAYEYSLAQAQKDDYLCNIRFERLHIEVDLNRVRKTAGDLNDADSGAAVNKFLTDIVVEAKPLLENRKCIAYLPLIETSKQFTAICKQHGIKAIHVDKDTKNRQAINQQFKNGDFQILSNVMVYTEGFDEPSVSAILPLRPTLNTSLYMQMVGRGTRIHQSKDNLLILEPTWKRKDHDIATAHKVLGHDALEKFVRCNCCHEELLKQTITIEHQLAQIESSEFDKELTRHIDSIAGGMKLHRNISKAMLIKFIKGIKAQTLPYGGVSNNDLKNINLPTHFYSCRRDENHPIKWGFKGDEVNPAVRLLAHLKSEYERLAITTQAFVEFYEITHKWQSEPATLKQTNLLARTGFTQLCNDHDAIFSMPSTKGAAAWFIERIIARANGGWASPRQLSMMLSNGKTISRSMIRFNQYKTFLQNSKNKA